MTANLMWWIRIIPFAIRYRKGQETKKFSIKVPYVMAWMGIWIVRWACLWYCSIRIAAGLAWYARNGYWEEVQYIRRECIAYEHNARVNNSYGLFWFSLLVRLCDKAVAEMERVR